jgi:hypothetical protein
MFDAAADAPVSSQSPANCFLDALVPIEIWVRVAILRRAMRIDNQPLPAVVDCER